ncbi:MAG: LemA family protein [Patescibacteria group bacterium]
MKEFLIFFVILTAILVVWIIALYNTIVRLKNRTKEAWSDIEVQLKRRHDLIPNLINSVKGYMTHEKELLEKITLARAGALNSQKNNDTAQLAKIENDLTGMLGKLQIAVEAYPDLKANTNVSNLMDELADTENKIQAARRFYNTMVRDFKTKIETFPNNLIAEKLKTENFSYFEIEDKKEKENIEVKF